MQNEEQQTRKDDSKARSRSYYYKKQIAKAQEILDSEAPEYEKLIARGRLMKFTALLEKK